jgi:uncharacterized protein (DUF2252 family)
LSAEERTAVGALFAEESVRKLATSLRSRADDDEVRVMDAAFWRTGCSSLGRLRLAMLIAVGRGKNERHCLMDVKEAIAAAGRYLARDGDTPEVEIPRRGRVQRVAKTL